MSAEIDTYPTPEHGWTCFHCGETFPGTMAGQVAARLHFGASIHDEPKCQISAHRLRSMELQLRRYREEDTDLHREFHKQAADHAVALRREEENGYSRGLKDYSAVVAVLQEFMDYQISDYDRRADLARAYCDIRKRARQLIGPSTSAKKP